MTNKINTTTLQIPYPQPPINNTYQELTVEKVQQGQALASHQTISNYSVQNQIQRLKKIHKSKSKVAHWGQVEQLYYFDSVLRFVIENPYLTVSWAQWKPLNYYNFIAQKMSEALGKISKNPIQIKTKDQNLKLQYHNKINKQCDIIDVALQKIVSFINKANNRSKKNEGNNGQSKKAYLRCDQTLRNYQELTNQMKKPKTYKLELEELISYIEYTDDQRTAEKPKDQKWEFEVSNSLLISYLN